MATVFPQIVEQNLKTLDMQPGSLIKGTVLDVKKDWVVIDTHLKTESVLPREEFKNKDGKIEVDVGDEVELMLETVENGYGRTQVSYEKARFIKKWLTLEKIYKEEKTVRGLIKNKVRGGFSVDLDGVSAFLPGSLVDLGQPTDPSLLENTETDFKIVKIDRPRLNMVVSHKAIHEEQTAADKRVYFKHLAEVGTVKGTVKRIMDYGAFIDLGKGEGLLHIGDIAWHRISHPSDVIKTGEQYEFKITNYNSEKNHLSLSLREMQENPWQNMEGRFKLNEILTGTVTSVTDYGLFVEVAPNIEGLVHLSELDWVNKSPRPANYAKVGDGIKVMVLKVEKEKCRLSLGYKQCERNPWQEYADRHAIGDVVDAKVKEIYDFGIFVEIAENMDGFIHINNLDWDTPGEEIIKHYRKGQAVQAKITYINVEEEKVSLSVKKTKPNYIEDFIKRNKPRKAKVKCTVAVIEKKRIIVAIDDNVQATIAANELSSDRLKEPADLVKVGDELEALVLSYDKAKRKITLSSKAIEKKEEREALKQHQKKSSSIFATLGDILHLRGAEKKDSDKSEGETKAEETDAAAESEENEEVAETAETATEKTAESEGETKAEETDAAAESEENEEVAETAETATEKTAESEEENKTAETDAAAESEENEEMAETAEAATEETAESSETNETTKEKIADEESAKEEDEKSAND